MARVATLLIVEDEPETAGLLGSYFQAQGYEVLTAASGEEALALARERLPDLVVLDIRLPDIDGFEVFRQLRAHRRTREIPVIFLTEKREREDRLAGLELGAHDYIPKPFSLQELRARVQNILRRSQVEPAFDGLTGLPGRPLILEHLQEQLGHAEWSVVLIGLDGLEAFG
jgi:DNA-binding response OmpR family regulator